MLSDDDLRRYRQEIDADEPIEDTVRRLRQDGHSRLEAVRVVLDVLDVSLREAKTVLLTSETWADARAKAESGPEDSSGDVPPPAPG
jgi:hypothetical protein